MFLVYIDEFAKLLESHGIIVKLFADDVKVYLQIVNVSDTCMVQGALDLIVERASTWQLQLSVSKCNMLTIGYYGLPIVYGRPYCNDAKEGVGAITPPKLNRR